MILFRLVFPAASRADIASIGDPALANAVKEFTAMDGSNIPQSDGLDNLSSRLDEALAYVEHYRGQLSEDWQKLNTDRESLMFWLKVLQELQAQIPYQNPFKDFIDSL